MGLFGGERIEVSSVAFNMAGDYENIPSYLKSTITGNVLVGRGQRSIPESIQLNYSKGPGSNFRSMFRWAGNIENYDAIGRPTAFYNGKLPAIKSQINEAIYGVQSEYFRVRPVYSYIGYGDIYWWALRAVYQTLNTTNFGEAPPWVYTFDEQTNLCVVSYASGGVITQFTPENFDKTAVYVYHVALMPVRVENNTGFQHSITTYKTGTGNAALDALSVNLGVVGYEYYPTIPIRANNTFLSDSYYPEIYAQSKKAYKKAFGIGPKAIYDSIAASENLSSIDHAYVVFGVSADTKENTCKQYLFKYIEYLRSMQFANASDYASFIDQDAAYTAYAAEWIAWDTGGRVGTEPSSVDYPTGKTSNVRIRSASIADSILDMEIYWRYIGIESGTGLKKPTAKVGEVWFDIDPSDDVPVPIIANSVLVSPGEKRQKEVVRLHWQLTANTWKTMVIVGCHHRNYIYKGNFVEVSLKDALTDPNESGFIFPLHKPTCDSMGLINFTQMTSASAYLVINCYEVIKTGFNILGILFFVAAVVALVVFPPSGGLLGSSLGIGTSLGLTATAAVIVGSIVNAIAAMIVTAIISRVSLAVFGDKIGAIIGAIVGFAAAVVGGGLLNGQSLSSIWSSLGSAQNLMALTSAVGEGVTQYVAAAVQDIQVQLLDLKSEVAKKASELQQLYEQNIGYSRGVIDPMNLTETPLGKFTEAPSQFLTRTLLTGTDIAEISMGMIGEFVGATTSTLLPNID